MTTDAGDFWQGGGGIYNGDGSTLHLIESTVDANNSGWSGGGVYSFFNSTTIIERSTISNNTAADVGGGVRSLGNVTVINSTISGNTSVGWHGGAAFITDGVVDVDWEVEAPGRRLEVIVDRDKAIRAGITSEQVVRTLRVALDGAPLIDELLPDAVGALVEPFQVRVHGRREGQLEGPDVDQEDAQDGHAEGNQQGGDEPVHTVLRLLITSSKRANTSSASSGNTFLPTDSAARSRSGNRF